MPDINPQLFTGSQLRTLRRGHGLGQRSMATTLGISVSYLSQIESGDRPITPKVLHALSQAFPGEWSALDAQGDASLIVRAGQAVSDPSIADAIAPDATFQRMLTRQPAVARRMVALHDAVLHAQDQLRALDDRVGSGNWSGAEGRLLPWDEVREWFHNQRNYIDGIDRAAERIADTLDDGPPVARIEARLAERFGVAVVAEERSDRALRAFDPVARVITVDPLQAPETTAFSLAHLLARLELSDAIDQVLDMDGPSAAARRLLGAGLANYAAGALLMPYTRFRAAAREMRHDIDRLRHRFGTSFEQTCHRLSTLQRPGAQGVPFFFCRVDMAGNITKRHSATRLQFARFGGACPLWIVHEAAAVPDRIVVQLAEMPDGARYISMAKGLVKPSGSYARPARRYAVALGCEVEHAGEFVYADDVQLTGAAMPIGASCRTCPRADCEQRAFPPSISAIEIDPERRGVVPYGFA